MWLFFDFSFVSVVQKPWDRPGTLCIRARDRRSLDEVRARCPSPGPTIEVDDADYRFRAPVSAAAFGLFVGAHLAELRVENFKDAAECSRGRRFHDAGAQVWSVMRGLGAA
jgi:hypothetical protein